MAFNPLEQSGIPVEAQFRNWAELNVTPFDKYDVHPFTRVRAIFMNGIEVKLAGSNLLNAKREFLQGGEVQRRFEPGRKVSLSLSYTPF